ncbi:MAG: CopD family protein [Nitrososphaeraceae archaeon]
MIIVDGIILWIHLICTSIWVGGSIFLGVILAPMLKVFSNSFEERISIMLKIGRRFNNIAFPSFLILIVTGIYNSRAFFLEPSNFLDSNYGVLLLIKITVVIFTLISYIIHIRSFSRANEYKLLENLDEKYAQKIRSKIINFGRLIVILSIFILLLAALLDKGIF